MIATALNRTWRQLLHPRFRSVFIKSVLVAAITLVGLSFALNHYWPETFVTGWDWIDSFGDGLASAGFWTVVTLGSYLLFPGIVTMVMGLIVDQIATAVEEEYYPNRLGTRQVPYMEVFLSAAKLTLIMVILNLLALLPYIILFFMSAGIGSIILFVLLNGYLIGREYFEMVAIRHTSRKRVQELRVQNGNRVFIGGAITAGLFLVPFVNLVAPIIGAALMTHVFHHIPAPKAPQGTDS